MTARRALLLAVLLAITAAGAWGQGVIISPSSLPVPSGVFTVGQAIPTQQLVTNFPNDPNAWSVLNGSFPPGLILDPAAGTIAGTPTLAGAYTFTVAVTDIELNQTGYQQYTLFVSLGTPLSLTPLTHPGAAVGTFYLSATFQVGGGVPGYNWSLPSGTNSDGLTISPSSGQLSGFPQTGGIFPFSVVVTDASGAQASATFTLNVLGISTASLPDGPIGSPYSQTLAVAGGTGPYTWSVTGTSLPPPGLTLSSQGQITGTPTTSGTFPFQVQVTDSATKLSSSKSFSITIPRGLTITTTSLPGGTAGTPYPTQTLAATGSTNPLTWTLFGTAPLPPGLNLSPQGQITGTPTQAGTFPFQVQVTDAATNLSATQALSITITAALTISPATLPNGIVNIPYTATTLTVAGVTISNWVVTVGTLPAGLNLNASTGVVSGTPTAAGSSTFTISATPAAVVAVLPPVVQSFTVVINAAPSVTISGLPSIGVAGTQPSATVSLSGGAYPFTITGTLNLAFAPASGGAQPYDAKFANGSGTTTAFTITPPATSSSVPVMIGTVAGIITITTTNLLDSNGNTLPLPAPIVITVNPTPPVIQSVVPCAITLTGFTVSVTGYSTPRDMASALFHFTFPTNTQSASADVTVPLTSPFTTWYNSSASNAFGSQFKMTVQFTFTGPPGATVPFTALTATLTNSKGASNAVAGQAPVATCP